MDFEYPEHVKDLMARVSSFMDAHIYPNEHLYDEQARELGLDERAADHRGTEGKGTR